MRTEEFSRHTTMAVFDSYACCEDCRSRAIIKSMAAHDVYSFAIAAWKIWTSIQERMSLTLVEGSALDGVIGDPADAAAAWNDQAILGY